MVLIEPGYPKRTPAGGRLVFGLERMLRTDLFPIGFGLSDPAVEEAMYDSVCMRAFQASTSVGNRSQKRRRGCVPKSSGEEWPGTESFERMGQVLEGKGLTVPGHDRG